MPIGRRKLKKLHAALQRESHGLVEGPSTSQFVASSSPEKIFPPPLVFLPGNRTLVEIPGTRRARTATHPLLSEPATAEEEDVFSVGFDARPKDNAGGTPAFISSRQAAIDPALSRHRRKRIRQCERWTTEVLPSLILPFLDVLRRTESLRNPVPLNSLSDCTCRGTSQTLDVICVYLQHLSIIKIDMCSCRSAPSQLLNRGLFGCAPCLPTLAVDLNLLEFCSELFLRAPPNHTAFCNTLESFLRIRGYVLESSDSLRKRFVKCLQWFCALRDATRHHIDSIISAQSVNNVRPTAVDFEGLENDEVLSSPSPFRPELGSSLDLSVLTEPDGSTLNEEISATTAENAEAQGTTISDVDPTAGDRRRPSSYLQARCPLCFGGMNWAHDATSTFDVAVCIDACFQQKRGQTDYGPPHRHPQTVFLDEEEVEGMKREVEEIRPAGSKRPHDVPPRDVDGASVACTIKVASEILDECEASFKAADERCQKASTRFFADTGLMALLCRHDRVLWLVNMQSAGEKQYYAFALLKALFNNMPNDAIVGLLYDIGCQLHRSITKWNFLPEFASRLVYAVSVFHAFGHQWACQLIYHPRKCEGFGFTDGEGCERFWSSIKHLIPSLRISGFYRCLHTLDSQVHFVSNNNLFRLGRWLQNRTRQCYIRQYNAKTELEKCTIPEDELAVEWRRQIEEQTKALPRQSTAAGRNAVEEIVALQSRCDAIHLRIRNLQRHLVVEDLDTEETQRSITDLETSYMRLHGEVNTKKRAFGLENVSQLTTLQHGAFIKSRMNARAVKMRLRSRLQARKFELQNTDRPYRIQQSSSSDRKKAELLESQVRHRDPSIVQLTRKYNALCDTLLKLASEGKAPLGARCPEKVNIKGLFNLDVDDAVWQDVGLYEHDDQEIPRWLGEENVRKGIRALLELRRSREELQRLKKERLAMEEWFADMWTQTAAALQLSPAHSGVRYALDLRKRELLSLCVEWRTKTQSVPASGLRADCWGPSATELRDYKAADLAMRCIPTICAILQTPTIRRTDRIAEADEELTDSDDGSDGDLESDGDFLELAEAIEHDNAHAITLAADEYRDERDHPPPSIDDLNLDQTGLSIPAKRRRIGDEIYSLGEHL